MHGENVGLLQRWWLLVGARRWQTVCRPVAALGWLYRAKDFYEGLVALRHLKAAVLHDEPNERTGQITERVVWAKLKLAGSGLEIGGVGHNRLVKDLRMEPRWGARGPRINLASADLLELALQLQRHLRQVDSYRPNSARCFPTFPRIWAGFAPADAESLAGDGPVLASIGERFGVPTQSLLRLFGREHWKLVCYPLEWVGGQAARALELFADLTTIPKVQAFRLDQYPAGLIGQRGGIAYDFYHTPFNRWRQPSEQAQTKRPARIAA
jgi:hypothetical protein